MDEILHETKKVVTKQSSPGEDGLGYAFLYHLFRFPPLQDLTIKLFNQAMLETIVPSSWNEIRVRLLPKKGDLSLLKNWRPISLINCDAKIFTRVMNSRVRQLAHKLINPFQTGFMPHRFIAENGLLLNIIMEHARTHNLPDIALLLDQENAYDRVHPSYLKLTLLRFGFPDVFVRSLMSLFFGNNVCINVNGHFTSTVDQQRGLRQGDPLSPLLFNFALDPFLRHLLEDPLFVGFKIPSETSSNYSSVSSPTPLAPVRFLAYADDVCVFLSSTQDYRLLHSHLESYSKVSNAKVNIDKTEAIFLNGRTSSDWVSTLNAAGINKHHDRMASQPLRYLGFPTICSTHQRQYYENTMIYSIQSQCNIFSQRHLSLRGKVTLVNSIVLSKLWYSLRVISLPKYFFRKVRSIIAAFVCSNIKPRIAYATMCRPLNEGGLGLIDPMSQQLRLQHRWIQQLLSPDTRSSCSAPYLNDFVRQYHSLNTYSDLGLFFPQFRGKISWELGLFIKNILTAFDALIDINPSDILCNPTTLMELPIRAIFSQLDPDHWILRPRLIVLQVKHLFKYDDTTQTVRCIRPNESPPFPRILKRLIKLIQEGNLRLNPPTCYHILIPNVSPGVVDASTYIDKFLSSPTWHGYTSKIFRQELCKLFFPIKPSDVTPDVWKKLWSLSISPEARSLWYRIIHHKVHCMKSIAMFRLDASDKCPFCNNLVETIQHLLIECPTKLRIWRLVLSSFAPHLSFDIAHIKSIVYQLKKVDHVNNTLLLVLVSKIIRHIWRSHWLFVISEVPFRPERIALQIFKA